MKETTPREAFALAFEQLPKLMEQVPSTDTGGSANKIKITVTVKLTKPVEIGLSVEW